MKPEEIIEGYLDICKALGKKVLTREEYRNYRSPNSCTTTLIEEIWGSWTLFCEAVDKLERLGRKKIITHLKSDKIVISFVFDGSNIDEEALKTIKTYCKAEKADLGILWGKSIAKDRIFNEKTYNLLIPYLATEFILDKDPSYKIFDCLTTSTQVNPLINIDKLSDGKDNIIVGSCKQYLKILPYKRNGQLHLSASTGTISKLNYSEKTKDKLNAKFHTIGAIVLTYNKDKQGYEIRNLIYKNGKICDLNKEYNSKKVVNSKGVEAIVLGDLHIPNEDSRAFKASEYLISDLKPKSVIMHDVGDFYSINHHNEDECLNKLLYCTPETKDLETELDNIFGKLNKLTNKFKDIKFYIASSNHDDFIVKWLNKGNVLKDKNNSVIGAQLFAVYSKGGNVFDACTGKNLKKLNRDERLVICGYDVGEHGDGGISGARGNTNTYTKLFDRAVVGHTHSPEIYQSTIHTGTLSKLNMGYNEKGATTWAHANVVIYNNDTAQIVFV